MNTVAQATAALLEVLEQNCPREHFPYATFHAYQADDFTSPMEEGISLYLFKVDVTPDQRQRTLYGSYLMTAWSPDPLRQQTLLSWAIEMVQRHPGPDQHLRMELLPLTIADLAAVWSMARTGAQPSVAVLVRVFD